MATISTGIEGLDELLFGGLLRGSAALVEGVPGAGKTTLGLQFICAGAEAGEPGLILTFEEFPEQMQHDAAAFGWDLRALEKANRLRVMLTSPEVIQQVMKSSGAAEGGPPPLEAAITRIGVQRVLVDSISHFQRVAGDAAELREIVYRFRNFMRRMGVTVIFTKEIESADPGYIPFEEYLVDVVIRLTNTEAHSRQRYRYLEILKTRGQEHSSGKSAFRFGPSGLEVFPRLVRRSARSAASGSTLRRGQETAAPAADGKPIVGRPPRCPVGVEGLDRMLGGGLLAGCAAVVAGSPGTGKTLLGLQFLAEGLRRGEPGVLLSIEEDPDRIVQFGHGIGLDLGGALSSGALRIVYQLPVELATDEILWNLRQAVRETKARRVVIDSLSSLFRHVMPDPILAQDYARGLLDLLREAEATCTLNWELPEITGDLTISDQGISALADTVLVMRFVETASEVHRVLGVLKMRGSDHVKELRAYRITDQGLQIQAKLHGLSGVLSGSATGTLKEAVEEILQPLSFIRGSAAILLQEELEEEARRHLLTEIQEQADHLTHEVCRFLDYELPSGGA